MEIILKQLVRLVAIALPLALAAAAPARSADAEVQRQLQQREHQQMELRLKMQQQRDRSANPPQTPAADMQMRQLDRDGQQRLQELHDQRMRGMVGPAAPGGSEEARRELERNRAPQRDLEQSNRSRGER